MISPLTLPVSTYTCSVARAEPFSSIEWPCHQWMNEWRFPINSGSALSCCKLVSSHPQRPVVGFLLHPTHSKNKSFFHRVFTSLNHSQNQGACPGSAGRRYQNTPTRFSGGKERHSFAPHLFWWCPAPPSGSSPPLLEPCSLLEVLLPSSLPLEVPHQLHGVSETEQRDCWLCIDVEMQKKPQKTKTPYRCFSCGKEFYWGAALQPSISSQWPQRTSVHPSTLNSRYRCHEHTTVPPSQTASSIILVWQSSPRGSFAWLILLWKHNVHTDRHQLFCSEFAGFFLTFSGCFWWFSSNIIY